MLQGLFRSVLNFLSSVSHCACSTTELCSDWGENDTEVVVDCLNKAFIFKFTPC